MQKQSLSFVLDPFLNDLNLLTKALLLLVIFGKIFSIVTQINFDNNHILVTLISLINYFF